MPTVDEQTPPPVDEVTPDQLRALHTALSVAGIEDRADRLAYVSGVIARDVSSSKELTRGEASLVLDELHALVDSRDPDPAWPDEPDDPDPAEPIEVEE